MRTKIDFVLKIFWILKFLSFLFMVRDEKVLEVKFDILLRCGIFRGKKKNRLSRELKSL